MEGTNQKVSVNANGQSEGDIVGISPVLLQAVTQTLSTTTGNNEVLSVVTTTTMAKTEPGMYTNCPADSNIDSSQVIITEAPGIGASEQSPQEPSSTDDVLPSPDKNSDGHLVIKGNTAAQLITTRVIGDTFGDQVNQSAIMNQLRQRLGFKVVVQMENSEGDVVFEDTVTPGKGLGADGTSIEDIEDGVVNKDSEDVNNIVKTVVNTIRDLSAKLGKQELRECPICGDTVTGFHYGVQTCESCKGFFKRTVQNKKMFTCHRNGTCEVVLSSRKKCPACRFQKCCDVGMKIEGIREDRSRGGRSSYDGASMLYHRRSSGGGPPAILGATSPPNKKMKMIEPIGRSFSQPVIPQLIQEILDLESLYEEFTTTPQACCVDKMTSCDRHKFSSMLHITEHRLYQIVRWARHIPNFLNIHTDDQILLLQNSWAELVSLGAIWRSRFKQGVIQLSFGKQIDMERAREMDHEEVISRMLHVCNNFRRLQVDKYEYVCLKVLALMLPDIRGLKDVGVIQDYQNRLLDALMIYTSSHYPNQHIKFGELLLRLSEVQRLTSISRQQIISKHSRGEVPEYGLLMELLKGQAFQGKGNVLTDDAATEIINSNYKAERIVPVRDPVDQKPPLEIVTQTPIPSSHSLHKDSTESGNESPASTQRVTSSDFHQPLSSQGFSSPPLSQYQPVELSNLSSTNQDGHSQPAAQVHRAGPHGHSILNSMNSMPDALPINPTIQEHHNPLLTRCHQPTALPPQRHFRLLPVGYENTGLPTMHRSPLLVHQSHLSSPPLAHQHHEQKPNFSQIIDYTINSHHHTHD